MEEKRKKGYECEFCPYKSPIIQHLERHVRTHIGERPLNVTHAITVVHINLI